MAVVFAGKQHEKTGNYLLPLPPRYAAGFILNVQLNEQSLINEPMTETIPLGYNLPNLFPNKDSNEDLCSFLGIPPLQWFSFPLRYAKNVVLGFTQKFILSSKCHPNPSVFSTCVIHTENLQKIEHVACFSFKTEAAMRIDLFEGNDPSFRWLKYLRIW